MNRAGRNQSEELGKEHPLRLSCIAQSYIHIFSSALPRQVHSVSIHFTVIIKDWEYPILGKMVFVRGDFRGVGLLRHRPSKLIGVLRTGLEAIRHVEIRFNDIIGGLSSATDSYTPN
jgi:hypothetical protein